MNNCEFAQALRDIGIDVVIEPDLDMAAGAAPLTDADDDRICYEQATREGTIAWLKVAYPINAENASEVKRVAMRGLALAPTSDPGPVQVNNRVHYAGSQSMLIEFVDDLVGYDLRIVDLETGALWIVDTRHAENLVKFLHKSKSPGMHVWELYNHRIAIHRSTSGSVVNMWIIDRDHSITCYEGSKLINTMIIALSHFIDWKVKHDDITDRIDRRNRLIRSVPGAYIPETHDEQPIDPCYGWHDAHDSDHS